MSNHMDPFHTVLLLQLYYTARENCTSDMLTSLLRYLLTLSNYFKFLNSGLDDVYLRELI